MNKNFIKSFGLVLSVIIAGFFTSCQKDDAATGIDNFVQLSTRGIETGFGLGMAGCYELVFPVTVQFSDGSTVEVTDYPTLKQAIRDWYIANGGRPQPNNRPTLVFPIQVINQAGEIITVDTPQAMKDLIALCMPVLGGGGHHGGGGPDSLGGGHHGGGHHGGGPGGPGGPCFTLVFPVTVSFPDGSQVVVNSPQELGQAAHDWNKNNPGQHARPEIVFPVTVTLKDGTQVVVNSKEELQAIKEACRG
ncbi:MAG: hypothetical protein IPP15_10695 [Saprospiraceae bacterium]|uniref:Uncharacterized protein n=1 Tax=Candidatus Opimibacter skivensis TaxID=2982028 RepID=A0A9D7XN12_9BACT|nr:hypothetical protein [Candidatus Opimibacter skivensis]